MNIFYKVGVEISNYLKIYRIIAYIYIFQLLGYLGRQEFYKIEGYLNFQDQPYKNSVYLVYLGTHMISIILMIRR